MANIKTRGMKEKIAGIISFLGGIGWGLFGLFIISYDGIDHDSFFPLFALLLTATSIAYSNINSVICSMDKIW